ncbi:MAG: DUF1003 domain-containing protein [Flavisolibacter sp.]
MSLEAILETKNQQLQKLNDIVIHSIEEEKLISEKLYEFEDQNPSLPDRLADRVAAFGGSWYFIALFVLLMLLWITANIYLFRKPFDPFPFIFLNLMLSAIAALQAPVILMSQNRKEQKDRRRAINDYMVNLKAEIEVRNLQQKLDLLISEQMKTLFELQELQLKIMGDIKSTLQTDRVI